MNNKKKRSKMEGIEYRAGLSDTFTPGEHNSPQYTVCDSDDHESTRRNGHMDDIKT